MIYLTRIFSISIFSFLSLMSFAQPSRWQQKVNYSMQVDVNVITNRFTGKQKLVYTNNSPDKLDKIFYHLYWNAFQPGSGMDVRSQELGKINVNGKPDWDSRVKDRISKLTPEEIGFQKILSLKLNGTAQQYTVHGTILEVKLTQPILPHTAVTLDMDFEAQVPLQVRRSGRDNPGTGVRYSMSQWYPKLCEYDYEGWHPTQYVAREFYGVWGDYDVNINIDRDYKLGAGGVLVNANEIGWGYDKPGTPLKKINTVMRNWHFSAKNVHDFVWAADPDYKHITATAPGNVKINVIYNAPNDDKGTDSAWQAVADAAVKVLPFIEQHFGKYAYPVYSFIQGGDGGMEYPMATLIQSSNLGTVFHEWMHSWYQMMLATNEGMYPWMDEGFASYAEDLVSKYFYNESSLQSYRDALKKNPNNKNLQVSIAMLPEDHPGAYSGYFALTKSGLAEPLTTHADHYNTNFAYSISSYSKGEIFVEQLGYITGAAVRDKILLEYYNQWRFKHPNANDFMVIAQDVSGLQLDWYKEYWINTTKTIDYAVDSSWQQDGKHIIKLERVGQMTMPVDVQITFTDGTKEMHNIPLNLMYGHKANENAAEKFVTETEWEWAHPNYTFSISNQKQIRKIEIDPSHRMADVDVSNNVREL